MSKSNRRNYESNPASKVIKLSGKTGKFVWYDKEKQMDMELDYPITFLPLDILAQITGFSDKHQSQIFSNEIHSVNKEELIVKCYGHGEIASGFYHDIEASLRSSGGRYTKIVYAMMYDDDNDPEIVKFQFVGASLSAWIDFKKAKKLKGNAIYDVAINITKSHTATKGTNEYYIPEFETKKVSDESHQKGSELDEILQEYFDSMNSVKRDPEPQNTPEEQPTNNDEDVPF